MRVIGCDIGTRYIHLVAVGDDGPAIMQAVRLDGDPIDLIVAALAKLHPGPLGDLDIVITLSPALTGLSPVGYLGTAGFGDLPVLQFPALQSLLPRPLRLDVSERLDGRGMVAHPLDDESLHLAVQSLLSRGAPVIAVSFLHADLNPVHEQQAVRRIRNQAPQHPVTAGHLAAPVGDEAGRAAAAVMNAAMIPGTAAFLDRLQQQLAGRQHRGGLAVMAATGGALPPAEARDRPIETGQGTQAAGIAAAALIAAGTGHDTVVGLDVGAGGAVTGLIRAGRPLERSNDAGAAGLPPIRVTRLDVNPLAIGGETPVWVDDVGLLRVEPSAHHAGAPICLGGRQVTVMDLQVALGRLDPARLAAGGAGVDAATVRAALGDQLAAPLDSTMEAVADGGLRLAADRLAAGVQRTLDTAGQSRTGLVLAAVGGAGPMLAVPVARRLRLGKILVPPAAGLAGALGCAGADFRLDRAAAIEQPLDQVDVDRLRDLADAHIDDCAARLAAVGADVTDLTVSHSIEFRFAGTESVLGAPLAISRLSRDRLQSLSDITWRSRFGIDPAVAPPMVSALRTAVVSARPAIVLGGLLDRDSRRDSLAGALTGHRDTWFDRAPRPVDPDDPQPAGQSLGTAAWVGTPVYRHDRLPTRATLIGPALIEAPHATLVVEPLNHVQIDSDGTLTVGIALNIAQDADEEAA